MTNRKENKMTDIFTDDIKELMKLATTDFDEFYKQTEKKSKDSGYSSTAASSGDYSTAASSGDYSKAASSGYSSTAASSGDYSKAASSGNSSTAASSGENSACSALGYRAAVKGDIGNLLMCSEFNKQGKPLGGLCAIVDGKTIKAGSWYIVQNNKWVEVDFTDDVFSYVLSNKGKVKKVKYESGDEGYIVTENGVSAHGSTIKEAREDLTFKLMSRNVEQFKNMPLNTTKTAEEWALVYRAVTGACRQGTEQFMKSRNLKDKYTLKEIIKETKGAYGADRFLEIVKGN